MLSHVLHFIFYRRIYDRMQRTHPYIKHCFSFNFKSDFISLHTKKTVQNRCSFFTKRQIIIQAFINSFREIIANIEQQRSKFFILISTMDTLRHAFQLFWLKQITHIRYCLAYRRLLIHILKHL